MIAELTLTFMNFQRKKQGVKREKRINFLLSQHARAMFFTQLYIHGQ